MKLRGAEIGSMSKSSSKNARKPEKGVFNPFPAGLRVLIVDDDPTCLIILEKMLRTCNYIVTKTNRAEVALTWLREIRNGFDIVISDVHMPDMDGFKLLEHVGLEMDLPVIMMSADDSNNVVMKGVTHGACDYLIKPVRIEALKNIWQHVVRKKKNEWKEVQQASSWDEGDRGQKQDNVVLSPENEGSWKSSKRKNEDDDADEKDDSTTPKKPRVVWSVELHQQFVTAVNQLGIDKAVPKKILELMNVPGLTTENVASHLQKYRLYLKRLSEHRGGFDNPFMSQDSGFSAMSSFSSLDLQAAQLSSHTLSSYSNLPPLNPTMSIPFVGPRNLFSFQNSNPRYGDTHQQQLGTVNVSKPTNLLHGIPPTNAGNMKMAPQPSRGHVLNETVGGQASQTRPIISNTGYVGSYDLLPEIQPPKSQYWQPQNPNTSFGGSSQHATSVQNSVHVVPSVSVNQSHNFSQKNDQSGIQNVNGVADEHTSRVKTQKISGIESHGSNLVSEHYGQEKLMCALLKNRS